MDDDGNVCSEDGYAQVKRCFELIEQALGDLGASLKGVVRTRIFVTGISQWKNFGRAHKEVFAKHPPATTMIEVKSLIDPAMLIEIEADTIVD